jgi:HNH endonuclease/AP2 domain
MRACPYLATRRKPEHLKHARTPIQLFISREFVCYRQISEEFLLNSSCAPLNLCATLMNRSTEFSADLSAPSVMFPSAELIQAADGRRPFNQDTEVSTMRQINLSQNKVAILDDDDFDRFSAFHWCYRGERDGNLGYAIRHEKNGKKYRTVYLHRAIMNPAPGCEVIFLNHDRLDCRRENLRAVTKEEARRHHRVRRDSKSGIKGVRFNPDSGTWSAYVYRYNHAYHVGTYYSEDAAARAYEAELRKENPELANAPQRVERRAEPAAEGQNPEVDPILWTKKAIP